MPNFEMQELHYPVEANQTVSNRRQGSCLGVIQARVVKVVDSLNDLCYDFGTGPGAVLPGPRLAIGYGKEEIVEGSSPDRLCSALAIGAFCFKLK
jgi:hypothetical protein